MPISNSNQQISLKLPLDAKLEEVINWNHPLLNAAPGETSGEKLLSAWRREPGYRWFFERSQIKRVIAAISESDWREYQQTLNWLLKADRAEKGVVPRRNGQYNWFCYSKKDKEFICQANRFNWLIGLAAAVRRDGSARAADLLFGLMDSWLDACPILSHLVSGDQNVWPYAYHPWAPLQVALRLKNWMFALHLLWDSPALTPARFAGYIRSIRQHVVFVGRVSPRVWLSAKGNHFLMESEALLYGSLWPWLKESSEARAVAIHNLVRCVDNQILPDGAHIEAAPGYHRGCVQWFAMPLVICRRNEFRLPVRAIRRVGSMLDFSLQSLSPDGSGSKFADAGGGRDGYQSERLLAKWTGRTLPVRRAAPQGMLPFLPNLPRMDTSPPRRFVLARGFSHAGYASARNSWRPTGSHLLVKLDGFGGSHSHSDFFSFTFASRGRTIIDDGGTRGYDDDAACVACKLIAAHNVLTLGQREMLDVGDRTSYWRTRRPIVTFDQLFCETKIDGAMRTGGRVIWPDGAWWRRELEFAPSGRLRICDHVFNPVGERVRLLFHILSQNVRAESAWAFSTDDPGVPNVRIRVDGKPAVRGILSRSFVYDGFFRKVPATRLTISAPGGVHGKWETVIEPAKGHSNA